MVKIDPFNVVSKERAFSDGKEKERSEKLIYRIKLHKMET
jgi:hypothetical protein